VAKLLALALPVPICPPDTMLPFILIMVGQFDDSVNSTENTTLDETMDKKITNWKGSGMKHSRTSLNEGTEENYGNFRYNSRPVISFSTRLSLN